METLTHGIATPSAAYQVGERQFENGSPGFAEAIADAHASHQRPRCMCLTSGVEMYVARLAGSNGGYIIKRMPDTGSDHAPDCPSYEPPAKLSGLGQLLGSAITEDLDTGKTTLRLDFALTKMPGRSQVPSAASDRASVATDGTKLSLRGLLDYLWDQAELTRWHPGFAGKRNWATVRRHLRHAAEHKIAGGDALHARLYVPEPFSVDERDAINGRRLAKWQHALAAPGKPQHLMLLIGELKEIVRVRYGYKAVIKHVPDQAIAIDEQLYLRLGRRFDSELALWGASDELHMVIVATFGVSSAGVPVIAEMSLMPVTAQWLPIKDAFERQLVDRLVSDSRTFIKGLRYDLNREHYIPTATLTDTGETASLMFIAPPGIETAALAEGISSMSPGCDAPVWVWKPASETMPRLPLPHLPPTTSAPALHEVRVDVANAALAAGSSSRHVSKRLDAATQVRRSSDCARQDRSFGLVNASSGGEAHVRRRRTRTWMTLGA